MTRPETSLGYKKKLVNGDICMRQKKSHRIKIPRNETIQLFIRRKRVNKIDISDPGESNESKEDTHQQKKFCKI